jgi:16S rRNA (uracil1498-N3)-methyltransferase
LAIIVGPEGGLSPGETDLLLEVGAHPVYLGNRILRAETAAIYGLAAVNTIIRERTEWQPV